MTVLIIVLNKNMSTLQNTSLFNDFKKYLKETIPKPKAVEALCADCMSIGVTASTGVLIAKLIGITEERLQAIEADILILREEAASSKRELIESISANETKSNIRFEQINEGIRKLNNNVEQAIIGDYRPQIFSIAMILLGLLVSLAPLALNQQ